MSNYVTPPNRRLVRLSRPYDFVYDSAYTIPSRADFLKDSALGTRSGARVKLRPVYESMFSELKSDRRLEACLSPMQPNVLNSFLPQYTVNGSPIMPCDSGPLPLPREVDDVTGANRAKYGIRYDKPTFLLEKKTFDFNKLQPDEKKKILQSEKTRRIGFVSRSVQTDFRDAEVQTDPYSPPFTLPYPGASPKVLALMKMTWGKGLPFTLDDIVTIERVLTRKMLEQTNRLSDDAASFDARIKLIEELEAQQWSDRERELEKLQNMKMEIVSKLLLEYSGQIANDHTMRLERLQEVLRDKSVKHLETVKKEYFRSLRKLEKKYFKGKETRKRNIIKDYTTFDSAVYAPLVRNGVAVDLLNPVPPFQLEIHRDYDSFEKLTHSKRFVRKELAFNMSEFKRRIQRCEARTHEKRMEKKLQSVLAAFKEHHSSVKKPHQRLLDLVKENEALNQPKNLLTPVVHTDEDTESGIRRRHCINLQKAARGRVIQKLIRNEIEENMNELLGMKLMFDMDPNCLRVAEGQMQKLIAMKKESEAEASKDAAVKEVVGHLEGETLNKMLDFLDKEMIRLIDERKIHALILLAERERRRKEAIEAGRRYQEEEHRRTMDEMFKHVVGITQATVDIFLEEMYIESSDRTADEMSRNHVRQLASTINEAAHALPYDVTDYEQEEIAADMVSSFMVPELFRVLHQEKLAAASKRYTKAAGQVVDAVFSSHAVAREIVDMHVPPLVEEHNMKGWAAADGSVSYLDGLIRDAVGKAMLLKPPPVESTVSQSFSEAQTIADASVADSVAPEESKVIEIVVQAPHPDAPEQDEEEGLKDEEEEAEEQPEETGEDTKPKIRQSVQVTDTVTEIRESVDESFEASKLEEVDDRVFYEPQLLVYDEVKQSLAAKSLQLAMNTEPGQTVVDVFDGAREMLDDVFAETQRRLVPPQVKRADSDQTMDEDTDDED